MRLQRSTAVERDEKQQLAAGILHNGPPEKRDSLCKKICRPILELFTDFSNLFDFTELQDGKA
jgi:hypothetical protein